MTVSSHGVRGRRVEAGVGVTRRVVDEIAVDRLGVRVDQKLGRIVQHPGGRGIRTVQAIAVALSRVDARDIAVPDMEGSLDELHPVLTSARIEQADVSARRGG
jgi:hypothetical protein